MKIRQPAPPIDAPERADWDLREAVFDDDLGAARRTIDLGARLDLRLGSSATLAMAARVHGSGELLASLLPGCPAMAADEHGQLALHYAADRGHRACVALLLSAAPEAALVADSEGLTPLMLAARYGHQACAELLIPHSRLGALDPAGRNPLAFACLQGHGRLAELLVPDTPPGPWTELLMGGLAAPGSWPSAEPSGTARCSTRRLPPPPPAGRPLGSDSARPPACGRAWFFSIHSLSRKPKWIIIWHPTHHRKLSMNSTLRARAILGTVVDFGALLAPTRGCAHPESADSFCAHCGAPMWADGDVTMPRMPDAGSAGWMRLGESSSCLVGVALSELSDVDGSWTSPASEPAIARARAQVEALCAKHGLPSRPPELHLALPA